MDFTSTSTDQGTSRSSDRPRGPSKHPAKGVHTCDDKQRSSRNRPWRACASDIQKEKIASETILSSTASIRPGRLHARAIVFCCEADNLLDSYAPDNEEIIEARNAVESFRQAATNGHSDSQEFVEAARANAAAALKKAGLEAAMRKALSVTTPEKWPVMHEIIRDVWCGGWGALNDNCRALKERGITRVVSVVSAEQRVLPKTIVTDHLYVHAHDNGTANLIRHFPKIVEFVDKCLKDKAKVYLHCGAGISRGPTATTAFIMWRYKLPAAEALQMMKRARPAARPNVNFVKQLKEWEAYIFPECSSTDSQSQNHPLMPGKKEATRSVESQEG